MTKEKSESEDRKARPVKEEVLVRRSLLVDS